MNDLIKSLEAYNIFNYLVPGVVMCCETALIFNINIMDINIFISFFIFYFVGLVASRIGSLIIGPLMRGLRIIKLENYSEFIEASKVDEKIELFSRYSSTYRTYIAITLISVVLIIHHVLNTQDGFIANNFTSILMLHGAILIIFILSYRRQTSFVTMRIKHANTRVNK